MAAEQEVVGFDKRTADRVLKATRSVESMGISPDSAKTKQHFSIVHMFEVVSGPVDGVYQVNILRRTSAGVYEAISATEFRMEDINEV